MRCVNKRKALFLFARQFRVDFCYIQEAHCVTEDIKFWTTQWGNSLWFSHGTEHSAGVLTLRNRFNGEILQSVKDPKGHFICLLLQCNDFFVIAANVYGNNRKLENDYLLGAIENIFNCWLKKYPKAYIVMGGDFNIVLDGAIDKWPPGSSKSSNNTLINFMDKFDLSDIWRTKFPKNATFTWSNKSGTSQSRLDYWLVSKNINEEGIDVDILRTPL